MSKFKNEFVLSNGGVPQTVKVAAALPEREQLWKRALCVAQVEQDRYVGLADWALSNQIPMGYFLLHGAVLDILRPMLQQAPGGNGRLQLSVSFGPDALLPCMGLAPISMYVKPTMVFRVCDEDAAVASYYYDRYLHLFDAPMIAAPQLVVPDVSGKIGPRS